MYKRATDRPPACVLYILPGEAWRLFLRQRAGAVQPTASGPPLSACLPPLVAAAQLCSVHLVCCPLVF